MIIAQDFGTHFLRDDLEIRQNAGMTPAQAYSLFRREPYGRVQVFAGPLNWAISESISLIEKEREK